MNELDFTIEFDSEALSETAEAALFQEADERLRELAAGHTDLTGSAVNIRHPAPALYEATVVVYGRPDHLAATEKKRMPPLLCMVRSGQLNVRCASDARSCAKHGSCLVIIP